jgi:UDP-glucose 4-epimerase
MKILITGGAGYIGSHVAKQLLKNTTHKIVILDNLSTGFMDTINTLQTIREFEFVNMDLRDFKRVGSFLEEKKFDAVIHFAASLIVPESIKSPLKYYLNNTANAANLIKCSIECGIERFIFSSTAAVYGEPDIDEAKNGIDETFPKKPINPYGQSKIFVEQILKDTANAYGCFKYATLRYFNVAGADKDGLIGQSTKNATHLIKIASQTALGKRKKMQIFGDDYPTPDGTCIRDYIDVDDLAIAHIEALNYLESGKSGVFNCGYGKGFSVKEVVDTMKRVSGVDFEVEVTKRRDGDPAALIANNKKIKDKMGWRPKYNNLDMICKTALDWEKTLKWM